MAPRTSTRRSPPVATRAAPAAPRRPSRPADPPASRNGARVREKLVQALKRLHPMD
jgi:hypothetical protein